MLPLVDDTALKIYYTALEIHQLRKGTVEVDFKQYIQLKLNQATEGKYTHKIDKNHLIQVGQLYFGLDLKTAKQTVEQLIPSTHLFSMTFIHKRLSPKNRWVAPEVEVFGMHPKAAG